MCRFSIKPNRNRHNTDLFNVLEKVGMEPKELEKTETSEAPTTPVPGESLEKEVCWDKPFTLSGGCCQD